MGELLGAMGQSIGPTWGCKVNVLLELSSQVSYGLVCALTVPKRSSRMHPCAVVGL